MLRELGGWGEKVGVKLRRGLSRMAGEAHALSWGKAHFRNCSDRCLLWSKM